MRKSNNDKENGAKNGNEVNIIACKRHWNTVCWKQMGKVRIRTPACKVSQNVYLTKTTRMLMVLTGYMMISETWDMEHYTFLTKLKVWSNLDWLTAHKIHIWKCIKNACILHIRMITGQESYLLGSHVIWSELTFDRKFIFVEWKTNSANLPMRRCSYSLVNSNKITRSRALSNSKLNRRFPTLLMRLIKVSRSPNINGGYTVSRLESPSVAFIQKIDLNAIHLSTVQSLSNQLH